MITNDAVIFGILFSILGLVFFTYNSKLSFWKKFYTLFPVILVCYFLPSFFNSTGIINSENSNLYYASGNTKNDAEQKAAKIFLKKMGL